MSFDDKSTKALADEVEILASQLDDDEVNRVLDHKELEKLADQKANRETTIVNRLNDLSFSLDNADQTHFVREQVSLVDCGVQTASEAVEACIEYDDELSEKLMEIPSDDE